MNNINVLQVVGSLRSGGLETVAVNYFKYIDKTKYNFTYLVFDDKEGYYEPIVKKLGANVVRIPEPRRNYKKYMYNLRDVMRKYGPFDIVHSHVFYNSGIVLKAAFLEKIPKRIAHSHTANRLNTSFFKKLSHLFLKKYLINYGTDFLACSSEAGEYLFGEMFFRKYGTVIKNSINEKKIVFNKSMRSKIRSYYGFDNNTIVLGHTGTLNTVKNQSFLIKLMKKLIKINKNYKLLLVGDGPERETLKKMINDLDLNDYVYLVGHKENIHELLTAMDLFLFPSLYEGLGISLVEAQATNLTCLISNRIPEEAIIHNNVEIVDINNYDEWIDRIQENYSVDRDKENSVEKYGYDRKSMMKKLETIYHD